MGKRMMAVCVLAALIAGTFGCDRKEVEYNVEQAQTQTETDGAGGSLAEQIGAPKQWNAEYDGNGGKISKIVVKADVKLPETQAEAVDALKMKSVKMSEDYKKAYLEKLSEGNIYLFDESVRPKSYWEAEIFRCEEAMRMIQMPEGTEWYDDAVSFYLECIAEYQERYDAAPQDYVVAENFQGNCYAIPYLGMDYQVQFSEDDGYISGIDLSVIDKRQLVEEGEAYSYVNYVRGDKYNAENNQYVRTEEQIAGEVQTFLEGLGIEGFSAKTMNNLEFKMDSRAWRDGCDLFLYRNINGIYMDAGECEEKEMVFHNDEGDFTAMVEQPNIEFIRIYINDLGVIGMTYSCPKEETGRIDDIQLLPFESIQDIAIDYVRNLEYSLNTSIYFNVMELCYCVFNDPEGTKECIIVPVWRLGTYEGSEYKVQILINAIDGGYVRPSGQSQVLIIEEE